MKPESRWESDSKNKIKALLSNKGYCLEVRQEQYSFRKFYNTDIITGRIN